MSDAAGLPDTAKKMLSEDACVHAHGIHIDQVEGGRARVRLTVEPEMTNGHGVCHGGIIFMLADTAMAYASNAAGTMTVTHAAHAVFTNPARIGDVLSANCSQNYQQGRNGLYDVTVTSGQGAVIAVVRGETLGL